MDHIVFLGRSPEHDHVSIEPGLELETVVALAVDLDADVLAANEQSTHLQMPVAESDAQLQMRGKQLADSIGGRVLLGFGGEIIHFGDDAACSADQRSERFARDTINA